MDIVIAEYDRRRSGLPSAPLDMEIRQQQQLNIVVVL